MNVGSLFAGIGGFDLGFERCGMQTLWQVEQNPYCLAVLAKHFPQAQRFEDVCEVGAHNLEPVDLICGGFPCQDLSYAGKGAGIDGARSGLWAEYARIVGELRPRYVVVENVPALLGRGLERVLGDLAALGYDAEWDCLPASAFGAPHQRDRIWLIAYPGGERPMADAGRLSSAAGREARDVACSTRAPEGDGQQRQRSGDAIDDCCPTVADTNGLVGSSPKPLGGRCQANGRHQQIQRAIGCGCTEGNAWSTEPDVGRVADELSLGLDGDRVDAEQSSDPQASTTGTTDDDRVRLVRDNGQALIPSPPRLQQAGGGGGSVHGLPPEGRRGARNEAGQEAEDLHHLRQDLCGLQPLSGQDLLKAMSERGWPPQCCQALGWWDIEPPIPRVAQGVPNRVDRLSALGNALVPQIAEWIGGRILDFERERVAA